MSNNIITIEDRQGPFQAVFQRIMRMVPERDKDNKNLQRLLAFRLEVDGEAATVEYLMRKIRDFIQCGYRGSLYEYLKDDMQGDTHCSEPTDPDAPDIA